MSVQYACAARELPTRAQLRRWAHAAVETDVRFVLRFVDATEARTLNRDFRHSDYATNVLTFVYETAPLLIGDVVICPDVITREAKAQGKALMHHYAHMLMHGLLHLQGYEHDDEAHAQKMEARERVLLSRFRIADPYVS